MWDYHFNFFHSYWVIFSGSKVCQFCRNLSIFPRFSKIIHMELYVYNLYFKLLCNSIFILNFFHYVFFFPLVQTCQRFAYITDFLQRKIFAFSGFCCISILCSALYYFLPWVYLAAFLLILSSFVSVFLCSPISIFKAVSFSQYHLTVKCWYEVLCHSYLSIS